MEIRIQVSQHFLGPQAQRDGFILLGAFLISFLFIRTSARLMRSPKVPWWPGSVTTDSGLHLHHLVWGIVLLLVAGFLGFALAPESPWSEILAALFGVGAGLTLDEFALWIHLDDVYWAQQGRASIDAVIVAAVLGGLIVLGLGPFDTSSSSPGISLIIAVLIDVLVCVVAILKGRLLLGLIGIFIPPVALWAALRLAAPRSWWARRRYREGSRKLERSTARFERARARHARIEDAIGGRPSPTETPAPIETERAG